MKSSILLFIFLILFGCNELDQLLFDTISGTNRNVVILTNKPTILNKDGSSYKPSTIAKVVGRHNVLCVILEELNSSREFESRFDSFLNGIELAATAKFSNGKEVALAGPMPSWSKSGKILNSGELSACIYLARSEFPLEDYSIESFEITATKNLEIKGIYWESVGTDSDKPNQAQMKDADENSTS